MLPLGNREAAVAAEAEQPRQRVSGRIVPKGHTALVNDGDGHITDPARSVDDVERHENVVGAIGSR